MDLFGVLRVTVQVTWLPRRKAADQPADAASSGTAPVTPAPVTPAPVTPAPAEPAATQRVIPEPETAQPAIPEPAVTQPATPEPETAQPALAESVVAGPPLGPAQPAALAADQAAVVRSLIGLADDLAALAGRASGEDAADRTLRLARWRVDQVLAECGVQVVCDQGPVEPTRHEVVGSRPAGGDGTAGWIAETVRRGYLAGGQLIRPQQVVAYAASTVQTAGGSDDAGRG